MKYLANLITCIRIAGAVFLFFCVPFSALFWGVYFLCGLSDMTDGYVARHMHIQSRFGALLDSIADLLFLVSVLVCIGADLLNILPQWSLYVAAGVAFIKVVSYCFGFLKFHRFVSLHTIFNKLTGGLLFCLPYFLSLSGWHIYLVIVCVVAFWAAIEELICLGKSSQYNADIKGIFFPKI